MSHPAQILARPTVNPAGRLAQVFHRLTLGLFAASFALALLTLLLPIHLPGKPDWPDAVLVVLATITTLVSLSRQLPVQNVILAATAIAGIGGITHGIGAATGFPFGPFVYTENAGPRLFGTLAWPMPLIWVIAILNSRGVARLILRPWRKTKAHGFRVIGLTAALTVLFDLNLEPFAARVKAYWLWNPTRFPLPWHGAPLVNFLGWLATALLIVAFVTPSLLDKRLRPASRPPDYHPLAVWLLANALFAAGTLARGLWPATTLCLLVTALVALFAIRGARW